MALQTSIATTYLDLSAGGLDYNAPYTFCGWVKDVDAWRNLAYLAIGDPWGNGDEFLRINSGGGATRIAVGLAYGAGSGAFTTPNLSFGEWYHIALIREDSRTLHAYIDGVLAASVESFEVSSRSSGNYTFELGRLDRTTSHIGTVGFLGWKAWDRALTSEELIVESKFIMDYSGDAWEVWPLISDGTGVKNGRHLTAPNGELDHIEGPSIAWRNPRPLYFDDTGGDGPTDDTGGDGPTGADPVTVPLNNLGYRLDINS